MTYVWDQVSRLKVVRAGFPQVAYFDIPFAIWPARINWAIKPDCWVNG
jgi:hypothetical protein